MEPQRAGPSVSERKPTRKHALGLVGWAASRQPWATNTRSRPSTPDSRRIATGTPAGAPVPASPSSTLDEARRRRVLPPKSKARVWSTQTPNPSAKARSGEPGPVSIEIYGVEAYGEEVPMPRGTTDTESLKAAAAAAAPAAIGLLGGCSSEGKPDQETTAYSVERAFAMAVLATATAQKAMEAAQQPSVLTAAAAAAKQADAEKQVEEANQAEEKEEKEEAAASDIDADANDSEDEGGGMTSMEYIMAYKELPPFEVELILRMPVQRTLFADTEAYKAMIADPSTTQDDIDKASDEHEENQNMRVRFHDYVRSEYEAKGYVAVSDEYIARRARTEEFSRKLWEEGFSDSDSEDDAKEGAH